MVDQDSPAQPHEEHELVDHLLHAAEEAPA